jgi:hypothetical protein
MEYECIDNRFCCTIVQTCNQLIRLKESCGIGQANETEPFDKGMRVVAESLLALLQMLQTIANDECHHAIRHMRLHHNAARATAAIAQSAVVALAHIPLGRGIG